MTTPSPDPQSVQSFAEAFRGLLEWAQRGAPSPSDDEVVALVRGHLGTSGRAASVVGREVPLFEQVNLQVALDAWTVEAGRTVQVHGLALPENWGPVGLQDLVHGTLGPPVRLSAPDFDDLPSGPDRTHAVWRTALLLVQDARGAYVLLVRGPERHGEPVVKVEVAGLATTVAQEVHRELRGAMQAEYDEGGSIGKRYRRQDEIGTPFCVTIDHQSLEDGTVTVRDRDTLSQERVASDRVREFLAAKLEG